MSSISKPQGNWTRDGDAFVALFRENAPGVRAFLQQLVGSFQTAEDLTQEIFAHLWSHPDRFDPARGTLRSYLFGIARHKAAEWWRRQKPQDELLDGRCAICDPERES